MAPTTKAELAAQVQALRKSLDQEMAKSARLEKKLTEALEQQTATAEVLKVISRSAFDLQPVLDTLTENAVRLCAAEMGLIHRFDGVLIRAAAYYNVPAELIDFLERHPISPGRHSTAGRAVLERRPVHIPDVLADPEYTFAARQAFPYRTVLGIPMLRGNAVLGVFVIFRAEVEPFTDKQIELVTTFADQAVIAIENVRLFQELQARNRDLTEALEQQTATSEILRVISQSPTETQPVFDGIARSAAKLCGAVLGMVGLYDGERVHLAAGTSGEGLLEDSKFPWVQLYPRPARRAGLIGWSILEGVIYHVSDTENDSRLSEVAVAHARLGGYQSFLVVPMLREGTAIGVIAVAGPEPGPFPDRQIELLKTFADQAVIAIENVRLFQELQVRNRDLTEALGQQTATSDILGVISSSPTDVQPVFDTIVRNAVRLCGAVFSALQRFDGELVHMVAHHNFTPEAREFFQRIYPMRPSRAQMSGRAILSRTVVQVDDVLSDPEYRREGAIAGGWRSMLSVPMLREEKPVGTIVVARREPGPFSDKQIALLKTFADQAVIAIENVRLFQELEARNRDLTEALEQQTATAEVLKVISRS
ncbi:MAG: GAF domain-containing protein, partial [Acidimicrobiia bacterium]